MARKHRDARAVGAKDVALAACRALVRSAEGRREEEHKRKALILARFAVAMTA